MNPESASALLRSIEDGTVFEGSIDLGKTQSRVTTVRGEYAVLADGGVLRPDALRAVLDDESGIYVYIDGVFKKAACFCDQTNRYYSLMDTGAWPALIISGVTMHPLKDRTPEQDARGKVERIGIRRGRVLDTCCGLGYTAIMAARAGAHVTTVEIDSNVLSLARVNPHSQMLFESPLISLVNADVTSFIDGIDDRSVDAIVHDPPTISLAGELYSDDFYAAMFRVLRSGGRLLHYTGTPGVRTGRRNVPQSVQQRLQRRGFINVWIDADLKCVIAQKPRREHRLRRVPRSRARFPPNGPGS